MYSNAELRRVYDRTSGYCHLCGKKLSLTNYSTFGSRGAWEVDHSRARANGGTHHGNNLYPACISCNRSKCDGLTRTTRSRNGRVRAPLSRQKRSAIRTTNQTLGAAGGALIGASFGLPGVLLGGVLGALFGDSLKVE